MTPRYESLTGMDLSDQSFLNETPKESKSVHAEPARYRKFSEKPAPPEKQAAPPSEERSNPIADPRAGKNLKIVLGIIAAATFMTLWIWEIAYVRYELTLIEQMKEKKLELEKQNEAIRTEIAKYTIYERVERVAREHLNLYPAKDKPGILFIEPSRFREAIKNDSLYRLQKALGEKKTEYEKP